MVAEAVRGKLVTRPEERARPELEESPEAVSVLQETGAARRVIAVSPARRFARLNALIAFLTFADGVLESLIYDDFSLVGFSAIFVAPFVWFAWSLARSQGQETARWLRISGWSCLALAATCVFSGIGALTANPVDVACIAMSAAFFAILGAAGVGQLKAGRD